MSDHEFVFTLELSDEKSFDGMLNELTHAVAAHVGLAKAAVDELSGAVARALARGAAGGRGRCDVRFLAHAGALKIVVDCDGADRWETSRPLR